jgi:hypothetical protein
MKNWDDLIITLLVLLFTFGGGIKELLRRKKSADRSRPYSPRRDMDSEEVEEQEEQEQQLQPVRRSPVSTAPIGEPQSWQEILEMLRPKEVPPSEIPAYPPARKQNSEVQPEAVAMMEDDEFHEVGHALKKETSTQTGLEPSLSATAGRVDIHFNKIPLRKKLIPKDWTSAIVMSEILGPPKSLR